MKTSILFVLGLFMMGTASVTYAASTGVSNNLTGDPGNSLAAHGGYLDTGGDPSCLGDIFSTYARDNNGLGHGANTGTPGTFTQLVSEIMTLGSAIQIFTGGAYDDCKDLPPPP